MYMYHSFLIHLSADGHLGCFHVLAIINSAAMNIGVHVSLSDLVSLLCMPRSGIAGSYGSSISSFLRNWKRLLRVPWTARRSNQRSILKKINPKYSLGGLMLWSWSFNTLGTWCGKPNFLEDTLSGRDWGQEEKGATEDEMVGWHHWLNGHISEQTPMKDREAWCAAVHGVAKSWTWLSDWTATKTIW